MPAEIQNYSVKTYDRRHITTNRVKLRPIEVDHAMPKSKDSQDNDKNLLLYGHCNYVKDTGRWLRLGWDSPSRVRKGL